MSGRLDDYTELLISRAIPLGLVASSDRDRMRERHIEDSLRAERLLESSRIAVDIGSGAGLPGIPLAIARPEIRFVLVESKQRAVGFLELVVERLGLENVEIRASTIEDAEMEAEVATARAFAPVDRSWRAARRVLAPGGRLIYFAGASWAPAEANDLEGIARIEAVEVDSSAPVVIMHREE